MTPAGEWVKMRINLHCDPKVIAMAQFLAPRDAFRVWAFGQRDGARDMSVTESVTESVTVAGLLRVWGVTRRDGVADGDDILLANASLSTIDRVAGVPDFGAAMASVGWIVVEEPTRLRFPKLVRHIASPDEQKRQQAAERQRRKRERDEARDTSRSGHANVTRRQEERREDYSGGKPPETPTRAKRTSSYQQGSAPIPEALNTSEFVDVWRAWLDHRRVKRKAYTTLASETAALEELVEMGVLRATAAVKVSLAGGWQSIHEKDSPGRPTKSRTADIGPGQLFDRNGTSERTASHGQL